MSAPALADVRTELAARTRAQCRDLATAALATASAEAARHAAMG
jgi:hypothetical protein